MGVITDLFPFCLAAFLFFSGPVSNSTPPRSNKYLVRENSYSYSDAWTYLNSGTGFEDDIEQDFFPIIWDIRTAYQDFLDYEEYYIESAYDDGLPDELQELLEFSFNAGVNCVIPRAELEYSNPHYNEFFTLANESRDIGLHLIAGGIRRTTDPEDPRNIEVYRKIREYYASTLGSGFEGKIIGGGGMMTPDAEEASSGDDDYYLGTAMFATRFENEGIGLFSANGPRVPYITYLEEQGYWEDGSYKWSVGYYPETETAYINKYCQVMMHPTYDWFVCNMPMAAKHFETVPDMVDIWTSADVWPESGNYYYAYADKDEMIGIREMPDASIGISVYEIVDDPENQDINLSQLGEFTVPRGLEWSNYEYVTSGPISGDCGIRGGTPTHDISGGIAFWQPSGNPKMCSILFHDGTDMAFGHFRADGIVPPQTTDCIALGQDDFAADWQVEGVMCQEPMRILHSYHTIAGDNYVELFEKPANGSNLFCRIQDPLPIGFRPSYAVWGYFWPSKGNGNPWFMHRSSFVLCDSIGNWAVVHRDDSAEDESWIVEEGDTLFGNMEDERLVDVDAFRNPSFMPTYFSARDYIAGTVIPTSEETFSQFNIRTRIGTDDHEYDFDMAQCGTVTVNSVLPDDAEIANVSNMMIEHTGEYWCSPVFEYTRPGGGTGVFRSEAISIFLCQDSLEAVMHSHHDWLCSGNSTFRMRSTRKPITDAMTIVESSDSSETGDPYIYNAAFDGIDIDHFRRLSQGIDQEHIWGVENLDEPGVCLGAAIQCYGRSFYTCSRFCPNLDQMMYQLVTTVLHGARSITLECLDGALAASEGGVNRRYPWVMTEWNAGITPESPELDLASTTLAAVAIVTGNTYSPAVGGPIYGSDTDYLSPVVSDDWLVMPDEPIYLATCTDTDRTLSNKIAYLRVGSQMDLYSEDASFLALEHTGGDRVIVMAANDSQNMGYHNIYFPDLMLSEWNVECVYAGPGLSGSSSLTSVTSSPSEAPIARRVLSRDIPVSIDLTGLEPFSVALYKLTRSDSDTVSKQTLLDHESLSLAGTGNIGQNLEVSISLPNAQQFSFSLYDLTGRLVDQRNSAGSMSFTYDNSEFDGGAYFLVLEAGGERIVRRAILLP